jgi:lysophospholipase L1-like esterase
MKTLAFRTWLVYCFILLLVCLLNIDCVVSWYGNKADGREEILQKLTQVEHIARNSGIGLWLDRFECGAGFAFDGSYKDKSKCLREPAGTVQVSSPREGARHAPVLERGNPTGTVLDIAFAQARALPVQAEWKAPDDAEAAIEPIATIPRLSTVEEEVKDSTCKALLPPVVKEQEIGGLSTEEETGERVADLASGNGEGQGPLVAQIHLAAVRDDREVRAEGGLALGGSLGREVHGRIEYHSVLLVGDSLAHGLAISLGPNLKEWDGAEFSYFSKVSSGLNNPTLFNWEKTIPMLLEKASPSLVLIMMGVNDANNHIRDGNKLCLVGTPEWARAYENRVENFLRIVSAANVRTCWIGVPVVREEWLQNRILLANQAARNACSRLKNCCFIDTFDALCDKNRKYTNYIKESNGSNVRIRARDGIHLSMAGSNLLSRYILLKLGEDSEKEPPSAMN